MGDAANQFGNPARGHLSFAGCSLRAVDIGAALNDNVVMDFMRHLVPLVVLAATPGCAAGQDASATFEASSDFVFHDSAVEPEFVPGIDGTAWRSNGASAYLSHEASFDGQKPISVSLRVALESYPSDLEVPADQLSPSSFAVQGDERRGFNLWINTFGRWGASLHTGRGRIELAGDKPFPLYRWTQLGFAYDPQSGTAVLMRDGESVATASTRPGTPWRPAATDLFIARPAKIATMLNFTVNLLNGAFDDILVTQDRARWEAAFASRPVLPLVEQSLAVPPGRFAADHLRPQFHAMPPANWTNEPHGLVLVNGRYHMFYQRTPNGPFKTQMVWGHMSSTDLVNWTHHRDALRPELQSNDFGFDMKGIWSGDVIVDGDTAYAYYTSVNHGPGEAFNPGISAAVSNDPLLRTWEKRGPIIDTSHVEDFRDPYLWQENDGTWHMIIGAALKSGGGLDYYTCSRPGAATCWQHARRFSTVPFARMDVGSDIWEMPVFEEIAGRRLLIVNPIGGKVSKYGDPATRAVYWLGEWSDGGFTPSEAQPHMLDIFPGHLSPTVARRPDGTLVGIGIVDERRTPQAQEDAGWAHAFSLPRTYFINEAGLLGQRPLATLASLRQEATGFDIAEGTAGTTSLADPGHQYEAAITFDGPTDQPYGVLLSRSPDGREQTSILYDPATRSFALDKSASSASGEDEGPQVLNAGYDIAAFGEPRDWRIFVDGSIVDVFIGDGAAFSFRTYPTATDATGLAILHSGTGLRAHGTVWRLAPARFDYDFSSASPGD